MFTEVLGIQNIENIHEIKDVYIYIDIYLHQSRILRLNLRSTNKYSLAVFHHNLEIVHLAFVAMDWNLVIVFARGPCM